MKPMPRPLAPTPKAVSEHEVTASIHLYFLRQQSTASMSDTAEVEVDNPSGYMVLPKDVTNEIGTIKLFNKWSYEDVEVRDISLT